MKIVGAAASAPEDIVRKSELDAAVSAVSGGSASWTVIEIEFGSSPVRDKTFIVEDAAVSAASNIAVTSSGKVATGRTGDDYAWDNLLFSALPSSGSFEVTALAMPGPVVGKRKIQYQIG